MRLSRLLLLIQASLDRFGDLDVYIDTGEDDYVDELNDVICEILNPTEKILLLTAYKTEPVRATPALRLVKS